jgi:hypothetical protein
LVCNQEGITQVDLCAVDPAVNTAVVGPELLESRLSAVQAKSQIFPSEAELLNNELVLDSKVELVNAPSCVKQTALDVFNDPVETSVPSELVLDELQLAVAVLELGKDLDCKALADGVDLEVDLLVLTEVDLLVLAKVNILVLILNQNWRSLNSD